MGAATLGSRAIIGRFYKALEQDAGMGWVDPVSMLFTSDQASETYAWLGQSPAMREWIGGREAKGFRENGITIANKKYEATLEIPLDWMRRDKTGQIQVRIDEMAQRANAHWAKLLTALIEAGEAATLGTCYDGQYFFDTDHSEGDSGTQSNDISVDITTATAPTAAEMETAILTATQKIMGLRNFSLSRGDERVAWTVFLIVGGGGLWLFGKAAFYLVLGGAARSLVDHFFEAKPILARDVYRAVRQRFWSLIGALAKIGRAHV